MKYTFSCESHSLLKLDMYIERIEGKAQPFYLNQATIHLYIDWFQSALCL